MHMSISLGHAGVEEIFSNKIVDFYYVSEAKGVLERDFCGYGGTWASIYQ